MYYRDDNIETLYLEVELSKATIKSESSQTPAATSSERFHKDQLVSNLQQFNADDQLLDGTIVAAKDKQEIKVCILQFI